MSLNSGAADSSSVANEEEAAASAAVVVATKAAEVKGKLKEATRLKQEVEIAKIAQKAERSASKVAVLRCEAEAAVQASPAINDE